MTCLYAKYQKSCTAATGYIPVRASGKHEIFDAPLYLGSVPKYNRTIQNKCVFTLSKGGKHLSSLFQHKEGPWYWGDIYSNDDALLVLLDGMDLEVFVFPGQRVMAEAYYRSVSKLPLQEIRSQARPVLNPKYEKQLTCYQGKQLSFT